jgi:hypothetical protein
MKVVIRMRNENVEADEAPPPIIELDVPAFHDLEVVLDRDLLGDIILHWTNTTPKNDLVKGLERFFATLDRLKAAQIDSQVSAITLQDLIGR